MSPKTQPSTLNADDRYELDERAGILEFEAGLPRYQAEIQAAILIRERRAREAEQQGRIDWPKAAA